MNIREILKFKDKVLKKPPLLIFFVLLFTILISGIGYIAGSTYPLKRQEAVTKSIPVVQTPEPTITPSPTPIVSSTPKPTSKPQATTSPKPLFDFTKDQYEITVTNINYGTNNSFPEGSNGRYTINGEMIIKNISVQPFILKYRSNSCQIEKDGQSTSFKLGSFFSDILKKGLLPGESTNIPIDTWFVSGGSYDSQGNLTPVPSGLKIKSCTIQIETTNTSNIESTAVVFP